MRIFSLTLSAYLMAGLIICVKERDYADWARFNKVLFWLIGPAVAPILLLFSLIPSRDKGTPKRWDVFLAYSHWDCLWASALFGLIKFAGGKIFLDFVEVHKKDNWKILACDAIPASDIFLLLDSIDSRLSENVQFEFNHRCEFYLTTHKKWRVKPVSPTNSGTFPTVSSAIKSSSWFNHRFGGITIPVQSQHPTDPYRPTDSPQFHHASIANIEGWLDVNLPAVEVLARSLGVPCPPRDILAQLMRDYLLIVATR